MTCGILLLVLTYAVIASGLPKDSSKLLPKTRSFSECFGLPTTKLYINNYPCEQAIDVIGKSFCYNYEQRTQACCEKCVTVKDHRNPDCLYGDKVGCQMINPHQCYDINTKRQCCETCRKFETGIAGCKYGDKLRCQNLNPSQCYNGNNRLQCCGTCSKFETGMPGCKYGDKTDLVSYTSYLANGGVEQGTMSCANYVNFKGCDTSQIRDVCCGSCDGH